MKRTQINLTENQHRSLKRWADRLGISMAEAIRRCVDERLQDEGVGLDREDRVRDALTVIGKYEDPEDRPDVGRDHDVYLADVFGE